MWRVTRGDVLLCYEGMCLVLVILALLLTTRPSAGGAPDAEILPPGVSVRQAPASASPVIGALPAGARVEVLFTQSGPGGTWAQIVLPSGQAGFIPDTSLRRLAPPPQWRSMGDGPSVPGAARRVGEGVLDIPLRRAGGVFLVTARLNNQITTNFVVDTGATSVMISHVLADQLGLDYVNKPKQRTLTASGFLESPWILIDSIHVPDEGGAGVTAVEAHVATLPGVPPAIGGLLGQSFLRHFHVTIDSERAVMHLQPLRP